MGRRGSRQIMLDLYRDEVDYYARKRLREVEPRGAGGAPAGDRLRVVAIWWVDHRGQWHRERCTNVYSALSAEELRALHGGAVRSHPSREDLLFLSLPTLKVCYSTTREVRRDEDEE